MMLHRLIASLALFNAVVAVDRCTVLSVILVRFISFIFSEVPA